MDLHTARSRESGSATSHSSGPKAVLGLREAVMLIVGIVIGAGIFKAPSMVAGMAGSTEWMFGATKSAARFGRPATFLLRQKSGFPTASAQHSLAV